MAMLPTSLPGGRPGGMTAARPTSPRRARAASVGSDAASSGVRPPSSSTGSSAQPSGTQTTYFMTASRIHSGGRGDVLLDAGEVVGQRVVALGPVEQIGKLRRERGPDAE